MSSEIDLRPLQTPYFRHLQLLSESLEQNPEQVMMLALSDYDRFSCSMCAACCKSWTVQVTPEYVTQWQDFWNQQAEARYQQPFIRTQGSGIDSQSASMALRKQADGIACVFLQQDNSCFVHQHLGATAKPDACQNYPRMVQPQSNGYLTAYALKSCQSVPALALQDQTIYYHIFERSPEPLPLAEASAVSELPRTQQYLWLGLVLDALEQDQGNILLRLGHLAQVLEKLWQQRSSWEQLYQLALSPARPKTASLQGMSLFGSLFEQQFPHLLLWFQGVHVEVSATDRELINRDLKTYLRQKWLTQVYSEPFHLHQSLFQHALIIALLTVSIEIYAFYLAAQARTPLRREHLARAIQLVERRLGHGLNWLQQLGLADLNDRQALLYFQDLVSVGSQFLAP